jgi:hypothetical protein
MSYFQNYFKYLEVTIFSSTAAFKGKNPLSEIRERKKTILNAFYQNKLMCFGSTKGDNQFEDNNGRCCTKEKKKKEKVICFVFIGTFCSFQPTPHPTPPHLQ